MAGKNIDLHAHFFNTRYLPIEGVLTHYVTLPRGIRSALLRLARLTKDDDSLERPDDDVARAEETQFFARAVPEESALDDQSPEAAARWMVSHVSDSWLQSGEYDELVRELQGWPPARSNLAPEIDTIDRRLLLEGLLAALDRETASERTLSGGGIRGAAGLVVFLRNLMRSEKELADGFARRCPGVGLFVHHMMDMRNPFGSEPDYSYDRCIRRTRQLCRQSVTRGDGAYGIVAFVAFDAYRPDTVAVVKDALLHKSFVGVKFYPACGYRPDDNKNAVRAPDNPNTRDTPDVLDDRCRKLLDLCLDNDVPILTHCSTGGMEVVPRKPNDPDHKRSGLNSNPANWVKVLDQRRDLRICFGHGGGTGGWFPEDEQDKADTPDYPWIGQIIEYCTTLPNVYLDISHKEELLKPDNLNEFATKFAEDLRKNEKKLFPLRTKVIYGSDYPMQFPAGGWTKYYGLVHGFFGSHPLLSPHREAVFRENAIRFLNLGAFIDKRGADLTEAQKQFLSDYRVPAHGEPRG